jgi:trigger factor
MASSYGMDPNEFIKQISNAGQVPAYVSELARRKAVDFLVANADITDTNGKKVEYQA